MTTIIPILSDPEKLKLERYHLAFRKTSQRAGCYALPGAFIILASTILMGGAALSGALLPGINVMSQVILPGIVPGACGIVVSIPFIVMSVKYGHTKKKIRDAWIQECRKYINDNISNHTQKEIREFVSDEFIRPNWPREYKAQLLSDILATYPSKKEGRSPQEEDVCKGLENAKVIAMTPLDQHEKVLKELDEDKT